MVIRELRTIGGRVKCVNPTHKNIPTHKNVMKNFFFKNFVKAPFARDFFKKIVEAFYATTKISSKKSVLFALISDAEMKKLNRRYRGKNSTTDVLSFRTEESEIYFPKEDESLGDVLISYSQAQKQAKERGHSVAQELTILVVHGLAHLSGYTHDADREAKKMERVEKKVLKNL